MMNIGDLFGRIFVINLWDESPERRGAVVADFAGMGVQNYEFIPAVRGTSQMVESMASAGKLKPMACEGGRYMRPGEVGCILSHRLFWKEVLRRGYHSALVVEDDAAWHPQAYDIMKWAMTAVTRPGRRWDIVHFHSHTKCFSNEGIDVGREQLTSNLNYTLFRGNNEGGGTLCYAITARGCERLLELSDPLECPADGVTNWLSGDWKECEGYDGYIVDPFPCNPRGDDRSLTT